MSWRCYGIFWDLHGIFNQHRSTLFNQHPDSWATCSPRNLTPPVEASDSCAWLRCCWEVAVLWPHSCQGSPDDKIFGIQREELKSATAWWFQTCFFFLFSISYLGCHPYKIDELLIFFKMGAPATRQRMGFFKFISVMILGN